MTETPAPHAVLHRATFVGVVLLNLVLTVLYTRADLLTNDDFYADPGHLYPRDGRWAVIPVLIFVDGAFASQHVAKPLAWVVLAVTAAALATQIARMVARSSLQIVGVALIVSLALMASPNMMWGPGLWYNALSFAWVTLALLGLDAARHATGSSARRWGGPLLWLLGTVGAALSYQPFAIIPVLLWLTVNSSLMTSDGGARRAGMNQLRPLVMPVLAVLVTALMTILLTAVIPSSRLERGVGEELSPEVSLDVLLLAYGRPAQIALVWAIVVLGAAIVVARVRRRGTAGPSALFSTVYVLGASAGALTILPLVLAEARMERFASTVQIAVVIGLVAHAVSLTHAEREDVHSGETSARSWIPWILAVSVALAGGSLALAGYREAGATLGVVLAVWAIGALVVWVVALPGTAEVWLGLTVIAALIVSQAMVREQLFDNWLSTGLDREIASDIALQMSRMDLSSEETIQVDFGVVGKAPWYSPLLRLSVAGPEVLEQYLSSLNSIDVDVRASEEACVPEPNDQVTVTQMSETRVTVCVVVETVPSD